MIGQTLGHYRLLAKLGAGGMGEVYLAEDTTLGRQIALKILPAELAASQQSLERFQREARTLAALNHPNIVMVYSVEEAAKSHFLTMELVDGKSLDQLIPPEGLPVERFFRLAVPLAAAVAAAHAKGVTHRDLKPANVMVTNEDQRVKVLDFGLAKLSQAETNDGELSQLATEAMTQEGTVLGTMPYMSPEQAEGRPVNARTDIFSLGIVLYEMATGKRPFAGETRARLTSSILTHVPEPVTAVRRELPRHLGRIISHCLEKEPRKRFQSALDLRNELKGLEKELQSGASVPSGPVPAPPAPVTIGRRTLLTSAAVGLMVLLAVFGAYFWSGRRASPQGLSPAKIGSIVALPADVFAPGSEAYLTDAVPSTLSTHLAGIEGIDTKMPPTRIEVERIDGDLDKLAAAYQVEAVVRSAVTAEGSGFVLSVQVVAAGTKSLLWGEEYRGQRDGYLDLVRQAAEGVRGYLRPSAPAIGAAIETAANSEAELALQRGRYASNRFNNLRHTDDFEIAFSSFERALELDPSLAAAASEICALHIFMYERESFDPEFLKAAEQWCRRSVEIDPAEGFAWSALSVIESHSPDGAIPSLRYALKGASLDPLGRFALAGVSYGVGSWSLVLSIEAELASTRAHPLYLYPAINAAYELTWMGEAERGITLLDQVLEIEPEMGFARVRKAVALIILGRLEEAEVELEEVGRAVDKGVLPGWAAALPRSLLEIERSLEAGRLLDARATMDQLITDGVAVDNLDWYAWQFGRRGAVDDAVRLLRMYAETAPVLPYDYLMLTPAFEAARADPRAEEIVTASRRAFEEFVGVVQEARQQGEFPNVLEEPFVDLLGRLGLEDRGAPGDRGKGATP